MTDVSAPTSSVPDEMSEVDMMLAALGDISHPNGGASEETESSPRSHESGDETPEAVTPGEGEVEEEAPSPQASAPLTPPGFIEFEGQQLPVADVRAFLELNERLRSDPAVAERVTRALNPPQEAPVLPDWLDPEDRTAVNMWQHLEEVKAQSNAVRAQAAQITERDQRARVVDGFRAGVSAFRAKYPQLDEDQVAAVAQLTGRLNIVDGLERTEGSVSAAFEKGMEMALWSDPKLRSLAAGESQTTVPSKSKDRKANQSALSGSGGSTPQTTRASTKPKTREELMAQMLDSVRNDPDLH